MSHSDAVADRRKKHSRDERRSVVEDEKITQDRTERLEKNDEDDDNNNNTTSNTTSHTQSASRIESMDVASPQQATTDTAADVAVSAETGNRMQPDENSNPIVIAGAETTNYLISPLLEHLSTATKTDTILNFDNNNSNLENNNNIYNSCRNARNALVVNDNSVIVCEKGSCETCSTPSPREEDDDDDDDSRARTPKIIVGNPLLVENLESPVASDEKTRTETTTTTIVSKKQLEPSQTESVEGGKGAGH